MRRVSRVAAEDGRRPSPLPGCSEAAIKLYQRVGISRHDAGPGVSCVIARRQPAGCNALLGLGASPQVPTPRLLRGPGAGRRHACERDAEVHLPVLCRAHRQGALRGHVGRRPAVVLYGAVPSFALPVRVLCHGPEDAGAVRSLGRGGHRRRHGGRGEAVRRERRCGACPLSVTHFHVPFWPRLSLAPCPLRSAREARG